MSNLSDNELDRLSREAAENFEPAGNAQSWNKLEQLLDKNLGKPAPVPRTIRPGTGFLYTGAILIAVSLTYFLIKNKNDKNNSTLSSTIINQQTSANGNSLNSTKDSKQETRNKEQGVNDKEQKNIQGDNLSKATSGKEVSIHDVENKREANKQPGNGKEAAAGSKNDFAGGDNNNNKEGNRKQEIRNTQEAASSKEQETRNGGQATNRNNNINPTKSSRNSLEEKSLLSKANTHGQDYAPSNKRNHGHGVSADQKNNKNQASTAAGNITVPDSQQQTQENEDLKFAALPGIGFLQKGFIEINDSSLRSFNPKTSAKNIISPSKHRSAFVNRSLQVGLLFGPEFSKVKYLYNNNRIGNGFGLTLNYQLIGGLSVNSGIIFSKKYYQASNKDFHVPKDFLGTNANIQFVDGSTNVIDIPLNLRFNYFSDGKSTFFVNGGFSSYIIQKENLNYYCQFNNNNSSFQSFQYQTWVPTAQANAQTPWTAPKSPPKKNYLFSILNLSAGFETSIDKNFSFQFEPYMKLPVKGIGTGKVDLSSYGVSLSIKYSPVLKRGRR